MSKFLDTYGNNIAVIVAILGFLFFLIVEWPRISEVMRKLLKSLNKMPLFLFKIVAIAASGAVAGSLYMMLATLLLDGYLSIDTMLADLVSGAAWGVLPALIAALGKTTEHSIILSVLVAIIGLFFVSPNKMLGHKASQVDAYALIWLVSSVSVLCGFVGHKTGLFLASIRPSQIQDN